LHYNLIYNMKILYKLLIILFLAIVSSCGEPLYFAELLDGPITEDQSGTETGTGGEQSIRADYVIISELNQSEETAGGAVSVSFRIKNIGIDDGIADIQWKAYISEDTVIGSGDMLIDSGAYQALGVNDISDEIICEGTWPASSEDCPYYVLISLESADDAEFDNNVLKSSSTTVYGSERDDVDYEIVEIAEPTASSEPGSALHESFTLKNIGTDNGTEDVYWKAYLSDDSELDINDDIIAEGFTEALAAGADIEIEITANWPSASGLYYIVVELVSVEDVNQWNDSLTSNLFTVNAAGGVVDYAVTGLSRNYPFVVAESFCSETFDIVNLGGEEGVYDISWEVYASDDAVLSIGTDDLVAESGGSPLSPLASELPYENLSINGTWPDSAGEYYLIVKIAADDDSAAENDVTAAGPFTLVTPPDYIIEGVEFILGNELPGTELSETGTYNFNIHENIDSGGSQIIGWEVFVSLDPVLNTFDHELTNGTISPLDALGTSPVISFNDVTYESRWPEMGSYYYVIINIAAGDDINLTNNTWVSQKLSIPSVYDEEEPNDGYWTDPANPITNCSVLDGKLTSAVLSVNELIKIEAFGDQGGYDTYKFRSSTDCSVAEIIAEWLIGGNEIDLILWTDAGMVDESLSPASGKDTILYSNLSSDVNYYLGVSMTNAMKDEPYTVTIYGRE